MMAIFEFKETKIRDLIQIKHFVSKDERGEFIKDYSESVFTENGIEHSLKEVFYTMNNRGTLRGMHFQHTRQQAKLVRCIIGKIYEIVFDLRPQSETFKGWQGFTVDADTHTELLIPSGCAHGYLVLKENTLVSYMCSEKFYPEYDSAIKWNDPELGIVWPLELVGGIENIILSEKDKNAQSFSEFISTIGGLK